MHGWTRKRPLQPLRKSKGEGEIQRALPAGENLYDMQGLPAWVADQAPSTQTGALPPSILVQTSEQCPTPRHERYREALIPVCSQLSPMSSSRGAVSSVLCLALPGPGGLGSGLEGRNALDKVPMESRRHPC